MSKNTTCIVVWYWYAVLLCGIGVWYWCVVLTCGNGPGFCGICPKIPQDPQVFFVVFMCGNPVWYLCVVILCGIYVW